MVVCGFLFHLAFVCVVTKAWTTVKASEECWKNCIHQVASSSAGRERVMSTGLSNSFIWMLLYLSRSHIIKSSASSNHEPCLRPDTDLTQPYIDTVFSQIELQWLVQPVQQPVQWFHHRARPNKPNHNVELWQCQSQLLILTSNKASTPIHPLVC